MYRIFFLALLTVALTAFYVQAQQTQQAQPQQTREVRFHGQFIENFDGPTSRFFNPVISRTRDSIHRRYLQGIPSISDKETNSIMLFRIDPEDPAGAGRGPEIVSRDMTHFGSYAVRLKIPDITKVQPDLGVVVGYFTYHIDNNAGGQSEIDIEWLIADPEIIYVGTWTGVRPAHYRVGRTLNMATGQIYNTSYREESSADGTRSAVQRGLFTGANNQPETITPIENFNAASQFYTYGWDWYPDRIVWWMLHPTTEERIILWDYSGTAPGFTGIPPNPSRYRLNFWHTNNWPVTTNPNSIEAPRYPYELEIDWMSYTPFEDLNRAYQEQNR
jgi:hypothetical protein